MLYMWVLTWPTFASELSRNLDWLAWS